MNKTLKKTLSIILTILMIATSIPFAFAADEKAHDAVAVEFAESGFIKDNQSVNQWNYSSSYAEGPSNMLDGDQYSKFCVVIYNNIAFSDLCDYYYVTAKTTDETGVSISGYQFTTGNDAPERDPVSWKFYGSNDNINWTVIDSKKNADISEARNSEVNFMLGKNSENYKYFRFEFEALREDQTTFQLSEIVLFEQHIAEFESCGGYVCSVCDMWYSEGAASHEKYTNGICDACGYKCTHKGMEDNICDDCGLECAHADAVQDCRGYYCAACLSFYGEPGEHTFVNNTCSSCGIKGGSCGDSGDNVIWLLNDDGLLIISGEGNIYDYQADGVASPFAWNSEIKTAVIEDGISNVPGNLFNSCQNLKSVTIGNDVESIGSMAFYYCQSLESVTIGNSVKNIGERAFLGNDSLKNVVIPDSVKSIGSEAFYECIGLESLTIGKGVISIGERAFSECTALESVIIPGNVVTIGENAFAFCEGLKTLTISEGVKYIEENAFRNCNNLESVKIPDSINSISYCAFYNCPKLESVTIPDSVTSIGDRAFTYCRNLKSITIPNSVTSIGEYAFSSCTSLENIIIGSNVTSIGKEVISSCDALETLHFMGTEEQWEAITKPADAADAINTITVHFDTFEEKAGFAPTCGTDGHTAILYCAVCDDYVSGEVIPATGDHDWSDASGICTGCGTECSHEWDEGVLTRPVYDAVLGSKDGYYTYTCTVCGKEKTEAVKSADYSAYEAASEEINTLLQSDELTNAAKQAIYSAANECGLLSNDLMESEQNKVDSLVAELEKIVDTAEEKIASGEYVKADYTEIDEAIKAVEDKLADENITDEGKAGLEEIKKQLEEKKADGNTSEADLAELEKALKDYEAELDKGIEDGTLVEVDGDKLAVEFNKKFAEKLEAEGLLDEYKDFIDNQKATNEALAEINEVNDLLYSLEGTVAENAENIEKINEMMDHVFTSWENCLRGTHNFKDYEVTSPEKCGKNAVETSICWFCGETDEREVEGSALEHSFTKYEVTEEAECGKAGKEVASCDHGCGATDENEIPALEHIDEDGDYLCDHGCGHEFEQPVDPEQPDTPDEPTDDNCDHLCHKSGFLGFLWKIVRFFQKLFGIQQYCDCGITHW